MKKGSQRLQIVRKLVAVWAAAPAVAVSLLAASAPQAAQAQSPVPINPAGLKKVIAARKGKVVVVNFWATWCGPCVEEFPDLVKLRAANGAKGLELITVSFDAAKDAKTKVAPFLAKNKLATGTYINKKGMDLDEGFIRLLEPKTPADEAIALPRTYIFDRSGKLVKVISGGQKLATFQKTVAPLLAKK